jgi:hypothetical protein
MDEQPAVNGRVSSRELHAAITAISVAAVLLAIAARYLGLAEDDLRS